MSDDAAYSDSSLSSFKPNLPTLHLLPGLAVGISRFLRPGGSHFLSL